MPEGVGVAEAEGALERLGVGDALERGEGSADTDGAATPEKNEYTDTEQGPLRLLHRSTVQQVEARQGAGWLAPTEKLAEVIPALELSDQDS